MGHCCSSTSQQHRDMQVHSPLVSGILNMGCNGAPDQGLKEPRLPPELEREVFEIVALQDPPSINRLILVAKRVKTWIEPIFYSVVLQTKWEYPLPNYPPLYQDDSRDIKTPRFKEMTAWAKHVGLQNMKVSQAMEILESCSNVRDLALWIIIGPHKLLRQIIPNLPVRRLHVDVERFFSEDPNAGCRLDLFNFDHIPLMNLTHLHILLFPAVPWSQWKSIALLPNLSHLGVDSWNLGFTKKALEECKSLTRLVIILTTVERQKSVKLHAMDPRLVLLVESQWIQSWETGAITGNDIWTRAEMARERFDKESTN